MDDYLKKAVNTGMQVRKHLHMPVSLWLIADLLSTTRAKQKAAFVSFVLLPLGFGLQAAVLLHVAAVAVLAASHKLDFALARAIATDRARFVQLLRQADRAEEALTLRGLGDYERILCLRALAKHKQKEEKNTKAALAALEEAVELAQKCKYTPQSDRTIKENDYEKSVEVAEAYNELGSLLMELKRDSADGIQAEQCYEKAIEIGRKTVTRSDPRVTMWLMNLGIFKQQQLGKLDEGLALYEEVLEIRKATLGEKDPIVAKWLIDMAFLLLSRPDSEAIGGRIETLVQEALQVRKEAFGSDHELVAEALGHCALMAALTAKEGESQGLEKARDYGKQSAEMYERVLGKNHPQTIKAKTDWGV
jgi:tetratricopeptide (TPR) repeat protein